MDCPCGSGKGLEHCCGALLSGQQAATTPEALMRSRYTAYVLGDSDYLLTSWHSSTRPERLDLEQPPRTKWLDLRVIGSGNPGDKPDTGWVEFIARYKLNGRAQRLHERSRFLREDGCWYYLDGKLDQ